MERSNIPNKAILVLLSIFYFFIDADCRIYPQPCDKHFKKSLQPTLRSLINVQSLITVQGVTLSYKKFKVSSGLGLFPFFRP